VRCAWVSRTWEGRQLARHRLLFFFWATTTSFASSTFVTPISSGILGLAVMGHGPATLGCLFGYKKRTAGTSDGTEQKTANPIWRFLRPVQTDAYPFWVQSLKWAGPVRHWSIPVLGTF
jgi:hypothetical protein